MKLSIKNSKKILFSLVFILSLTFSQNAYAFDFSHLSSGLKDIWSAVNQSPFIIKIRSDFCNQYTKSTANNDWKSGDFRANIGISICTDFTPTPTDPNLYQSPIVLPKISIPTLSFPQISFP